MSVLKGSGGISVQKSKFAALALDSLSDDEGSDNDSKWTQVKPTSAKHKAKKNPKVAGEKDGERPLSKNAKKRAARKKKQQNLSESSDGKTADSAAPSGDLSWDQEAKMRNQAATDLEFQQDLEKALLLSQVDAQEHAKALEESKLAERIAISESLLLGKPTAKSGSKKGVTLSLQEFHRGETSGNHKPVLENSHSQLSDLTSHDLVTPTMPDKDFFDCLSESVQKELVKEEKKAKSVETSDSQQDHVNPEDLSRVAQLRDELEKRDAQIQKLQKHNELLKKTLKEVKLRNQSLCKILSQGEFSTKTELIEQVDELTTVKNELTEEVKSLSSQLEQERSRNKALKLELTKHQGGSSKTKSGSSN